MFIKKLLFWNTRLQKYGLLDPHITIPYLKAMLFVRTQIPLCGPGLKLGLQSTCIVGLVFISY